MDKTETERLAFIREDVDELINITEGLLGEIKAETYETMMTLIANIKAAADNDPEIRTWKLKS